jgi:hypothetical protein
MLLFGLPNPDTKKEFSVIGDAIDQTVYNLLQPFGLKEYLKMHASVRFNDSRMLATGYGQMLFKQARTAVSYVFWTRVLKWVWNKFRLSKRLRLRKPKNQITNYKPEKSNLDRLKNEIKVNPFGKSKYRSEINIRRIYEFEEQIRQSVEEGDPVTTIILASHCIVKWISRWF